jgi:hypothetical protein
MLPLAWTQPVNTTPRIPYAATQPFELFFAAILVHWLWKINRSDKPLDSANMNSSPEKQLNERNRVFWSRELNFGRALFRLPIDGSL